MHTVFVEGKMLSFDSLLEEHDAVLIATRAGLPWFMEMLVNNLNGVYSANEYLPWTLQVSNRVSYWYGVRSLKELFYQDYFENLARSHENFTLHVALSEQQPGNSRQSPADFIHKVLKHEYLDSHPGSSQVDYFLCGPPAMMQAAIVKLKDFCIHPAEIANDEF